MLRQFACALVVLLGALSSTCFADGDDDNVMKIKSPRGAIGPKLRTNIALVGTENPVTSIQQELPSVLVDPSKLYDHVSAEFRKTDIEEDPEDRFVTTRSGKSRVQLVDEPEDWADESPLNPYSLGKVLIRKKRCGGGDDDGDANRSRRARRARRARRTQRNRVRRERRRQRKAARRAARTRTTTITRTILPANQVATYQVQPAGQVIVQQQPQAVVQTVQSQPQTITTQTYESVQQPAQMQMQIQGQAAVAGAQSHMAAAAATA